VSTPGACNRRSRDRPFLCLFLILGPAVYLLDFRSDGKADNWRMRNFRDNLVQADQRGVAIGHFNISDLAALKGVAEAARVMGVPVAVGVSESERKFMGVRETVALIRSIRETHSQPIYLNADHTHSLSGAEEAVRAGFDSVVFDRSELPPEQNIAETRQAVEALKSINPDIVVEGEIGYIGSGSEIRDQPPADLALTTPEEARHFVQETRVDVLSPAVGNMHGLLKSMLAGTAEKRLRIDLIEDIKRAACNGEEMRPILPLHALVVHQANVRFIH
jgi:fructose-bisphosphate aldolase, class II